MATASTETKTHPERKTQQLAELTGLIEQSNVIGIVKISSIGTRQLQGIKRSLSGQASVKVVKNTLVKKAAEKVGVKKRGIDQLTPLLNGQNAFIFTNMSPYRLAMIFSKSKVKAPAKAGSMALNDVIVPAGNTGFTPGPIISQLGEVKLPTRVEGGSIWITRDTVVAAKGEKISQTLAIILSRLGIEPFEVQLRLAAAYDNGEILPASVLDLDEEKMINEIREAYKSAINLSVYAGIVSSDTITMLLAKGEGEAVAIQRMIEGKTAAK
jgi:large subunit ribosomal protein L10